MSPLPVAEPLPASALLLLLLPLLFFGLVLLLQRFLRCSQSNSAAPDGAIPTLAEQQGTSLFHRWEVRCKLAGLFAYVLLVASLQHLTPALIALGISLLALLLARTPLLRGVTRALAVCGFMSLFLIVMPFSVLPHPGDQLFVVAGLEGLPFNLRGLTLATTIALKGIAIALLTEPMFATAPLSTSLQGLSRLGVPAMLGQMVLLSHRYLHVFGSESARMATAMRVRGFRKRTGLASCRALANFFGMLFVRSFERTERVADAMRARGYRGQFPQEALPAPGSLDLLLLTFWLLLGAALLAADRFWS